MAIFFTSDEFYRRRPLPPLSPGHIFVSRTWESCSGGGAAISQPRCEASFPPHASPHLEQMTRIKMKRDSSRRLANDFPFNVRPSLCVSQSVEQAQR